MANSTIQIRRSTANATIPTLAAGELAFTANGDTLHIGSPNGSTIAIGGFRVPGTLTANQGLVANSTSGINRVRAANVEVLSYLQVNGSVGTAGHVLYSGGAAANAYWAAATGGSSLDGLSDVTIATIANNDLLVYDATAGQWENHPAGNGFTFAGQVPAVLGGTGVVVNTTGIHLASNVTFSNVVTTDMTVQGNLTVTGTLTAIDATNLAVNDSIISMGRNNAANTIDLGFFGQYNDGTERFAGLIWDASANKFELFANSTAEPTTTVNIGATGHVLAPLRAFLESSGLATNSTSVNLTANSTVNVHMVANTLTLTTGLAGTSGGTGKLTVANNSLLVGNSTNGYNERTLGSQGQVLQVDAGAIAWGAIDGGTF